MKKTLPILLLAVACGFGVSGLPATAQEAGDFRPGIAVRAGADRMTIGSFRDSYTSLGFNSYTLEWDFITRGGAGSYSAAYNRPVFAIGLTYNGLDEVKFRSQNGHYSGMVAAYGASPVTLSGSDGSRSDMTCSSGFPIRTDITIR